MSEYRFSPPPRQDDAVDFFKRKNPSPSNPVQSPDHYTVGGIEAIDYMMAKSTADEFRGYLRLSALKYLSRAGHKDDELQEYKKAAVFLNWLINFMETGLIRPDK